MTNSYRVLSVLRRTFFPQRKISDLIEENRGETVMFLLTGNYHLYITLLYWLYRFAQQPCFVSYARFTRFSDTKQFLFHIDLVSTKIMYTYMYKINASRPPGRWQMNEVHLLLLKKWKSGFLCSFHVFINKFIDVFYLIMTHVHDIDKIDATTHKPCQFLSIIWNAHSFLFHVICQLLNLVRIKIKKPYSKNPLHLIRFFVYIHAGMLDI